MTFLYPGWLSLLGLIPIIVFLHSRRTRVAIVPSLVIIQRLASSKNAHGRAPSHMPKHRLPMYLQILALVVAVLALAHPVSGRSPEHFVFLIDASVTMQATDAEPSRFDSAVERALGAIRSLRVGTRYTVVVAKDWPETVMLYSSDATALPERLRSIEPIDGTAAWLEAARHVAQAFTMNPDSRIVVFTDSYGQGPIMQSLVQAGVTTESIELHVQGGPEFNNVGFSGVTLEEAAASGDTATGWIIAGEIVGTGEIPETVTVNAVFHPMSGQRPLLWDTVEIPLASGTGHLNQYIEVPGPGIIELKLMHDDAFVLDNTWLGTAVHDAVIDVLLIGTQTNSALARALRSIPLVSLTHASEALEDFHDYDLVIVDGVLLEHVPGVSLALFGRSTSLGFAPAVESPVVPTSWSPLHALSSGVDWSTIVIGRRWDVEPLPGAHIVAGVNSLPLVQARTTEHGRQVLVAFSPEDSNWPSHPSWPLFVASLVEWSAPAHRLSGQPTCAVGSRCPLSTKAFGDDWRLTHAKLTPSLTPWSTVATIDDQLASMVWPEGVFDAYFLPKHSGIYQLSGSSHSEYLAVQYPAFMDAHPAMAPGASTLGLRQPTNWRELLLLVSFVIIVSDLLMQLVALTSEPRIRLGTLLTLRGRVSFSMSLVALLGLAAGLYVAPWPVLSKQGSRPVLILADTPRGIDQVSWIDDNFPTTSNLTVIKIDPNSATIAHPESSDWFVTRDIGAAVRLASSPAIAGAGIASLDILAPRELWLPPDEFVEVAARLRPMRIPINVEISSNLGTPHVPELAIGAAGPVHYARPGEVIDVPVVLGSSMDREVSIEARRDGVLAGSTTHHVTAGLTTVSVEVQIGDESGSVALDFQAVDPYQEVYSDAYRTYIQVGETIRALVVTPHPSLGNTLASVLSPHGVRVEVDSPSNAPWNLSQLDQYDTVVLLDVPAASFHSARQDVLEEWVRMHGGGLLLVGGQNSFGPGGYYSTVLETLSPLSARTEEPAPNVTLVFVLDRSGSMQGSVGSVTRLTAAQEATIAAIDLLGEESSVSVIAFDSEAEVVVPLTPVTSRAELHSAIHSVSAGGGTNLYPALAAALDEVRKADTAAKHIVVLTDGLSRPGDFATILDAFRTEGASVSFIGIGEGSDQTQLALLANLSGGTFHMTTDLRALPSIMSQEAMLLASTPVYEGRALVHEMNPIGAEYLRSVRPNETPISLDGYVKTTVKPEAHVHWSVGGGGNAYPLMASWRYGLGRVVAFTSQPIGPWSGDLGVLAFETGMWSEVIRWITPRLLKNGVEVYALASGTVLDVIAEPVSPETVRSASDLTAELRRLQEHSTSDIATFRLLDTGRYITRLVSPTIDQTAQLRITSLTSPTASDPDPYEAYVSLRESPLNVLSVALPGLSDLALVASADQMSSATSDVGINQSHHELRFHRHANPWLVLAILAFLVSLAFRYLT